jgi:hypothetical protein
MRRWEYFQTEADDCSKSWGDKEFLENGGIEDFPQVIHNRCCDFQTMTI